MLGGDRLAFLILSCYLATSHAQPGVGFGAPDLLDGRFRRRQGFGGPVLAYLRKETMFDGIPLRSARRIMADGHAQSSQIAELIRQPVFETCER